MKRILFILCFIFVVLDGNSQVITNVNIQIGCNNDPAYIVVETDIPAGWFIFNQYDSISMSYFTIQSGIEDSVVLINSCGNISVEVLNSSFVPSDDSTFFVPCPMRSKPGGKAHVNIECNGDSTGYLKHEVVGGVPFIDSSGNPYYNYYWQRFDSLLMIWNIVLQGPNEKILDGLYNGTEKRIKYRLLVEDSRTSIPVCLFQPFDDITGLPITYNMFQPDELIIDSIVPSFEGCKGDDKGSIEIWVKGGKRLNPDGSFDYNGDEYYHYYLFNDSGDTVAHSEYPDSSSNFSTLGPSNLNAKMMEHVKFSSLPVGNYFIHVEDSNGCFYDDTITITEPHYDSLYVSIDSNSSFVCEQDSTSIEINGVYGSNPNLSYYGGMYVSNPPNFSYYWEGTLPNSDSMYVPAGTYKAYITDSYGCMDSLNYTFTAPYTISCDVTSDTAECFGTNTGSLQVDSIYGGTPPYTVQWGGINTDSLYAGTYTLFITDYYGCIYMEDHEVFENPDVNLNEIIQTPLCHGDSNGSIVINISGGTSPLNYFWLSPSPIGPDSLSSLPTGTYFLETTDSLGCTFSDSVLLSEPDTLVVDFGGYTDPLFCNGGQTLINAIITGGTFPYNLTWSTFDTTNQIVVYAGNYNLSVTDTNGCISTKQILITEPELLEIVSTSFFQSTCNVGATASVIVSGGTPLISYIWSNGDTTSSVSDLEEGTQWVIVTDFCGDTVTYSFEVEAYILETDIDYYNDPVLHNSAEVEVLYPHPGTLYSYQWYDEDMNPITGETNNIIEDLCPRWYYCITTDDNNCEITDSIFATLLMEGIVDENTTTVYSDDLLWGAEPYTYLWETGESAAHANICPEDGWIWVEVTDVNGCMEREDIIVDPFILLLSPPEIIVECDITNLDVELEITATGGTGNYTYLWSNGQTENTINLSLNPGVYSVQITDDNLCNQDTVFHIAVMSSDCIPNVFSPNDDGSNDVWNLEDAFLYVDSEVKVYNRYGKLVFKSVGYNTPWDGKDESGNNLEDGAYFYTINLGNDIKKIKGTVTIIQ